MSEAWTFAGHSFTWLRQDAAGHMAKATWNSEARIVERPLLDSGDADIAIVGYQPYKIAGEIYIAQAVAAAFQALNGAEGTISDGTTSWRAVLEIELKYLVPAGAGAVGTATFTRPKAAS